ncbi:hypothetical protein C8J57DRAFT_118760, partial [Mycena rebaudengoi]
DNELGLWLNSWRCGDSINSAISSRRDLPKVRKMRQVGCRDRDLHEPPWPFLDLIESRFLERGTMQYCTGHTPSTTANPALELAHPPLENGPNGLLAHDDATLRSEVLADTDSTPKVADGFQDPLTLSGARMHDAYPGGLADAESLVAISSALALRSQADELGPGVAYMANGTLWHPPPPVPEFPLVPHRPWSTPRWHFCQ